MAMSDVNSSGGGMDEQGTLSGPNLDIDTLCNTLASAPRRQVVDVVADLDDGIPLKDLVASMPDTTTTDEESTMAALYHFHLPKLTAHGIVEYNRQTEVVHPTEDTVPCQHVLDTLRTYCESG